MKQIILKQNDRWRCAAISVYNALHLLGDFSNSLKKIVRACNTNGDGTDDYELLRGIQRLGYKGVMKQVKIKNRDDIEGIFTWIDKQQSKGRPIILCCVDFDHWVTLYGRHSNRYIIMDPMNGNKYEEATKKQLTVYSIYVDEDNEEKWFCAVAIRRN